MAQFRLTAKMAKALKISSLMPPRHDPPVFFDDWYLDIIKVMRKSVVIAMHVKSRMGMAFCLSDIGGVKGFFEFFPFYLKHNLYDCGIHDYYDLCGEIESFYETDVRDYSFVKTDNRSVGAHVIQFKDLLEIFCYENDRVDQQFFDQVNDKWLSWLLRTPESEGKYTEPRIIWQSQYNSKEERIIKQNTSTEGNIIRFPTSN